MRDDFSSVDGVVFDFGGVISVSPRDKWPRTLYPYCESIGLPAEIVRQGFTKYRALWDGDIITFDEMYAQVFADAGLPPPTPEQLDRLWHLDAGSWVDELRPETLALMNRLKGEGKKLGILSNMSGEFYTAFFCPACFDYLELVDVEVISGLEHLCKPDRAIYDLAAERMGIKPARLLFLDDTLENVEAARSFGWQAELY